MNKTSWRRCSACLLFLLLLSFLTCAECQHQHQQQQNQQQQQQQQQQKIVTYSFTEFPYKESAKNEAMFREYEAACEAGCMDRNGVSKVLCTRQCVSPSCYRDLYQSDQLEEGEVDVRLNSFKGCFIQRYNRSRL